MWIKIALSASLTASFGFAQLKYSGCPDLKDSDLMKTTLDNSGLKEPNLIQASKDGRVFYGTRQGTIKVYKPDLLSSVESIKLRVNTFSEEGLIGMQLDP